MINRTEINTPIGLIHACSTEKGICLLEFTDMKSLEKDLKYIETTFDEKISSGSNPHLELLKKQLDLYFNKKIKEFTIPLHLTGTPFQQNVWTQLQRIPFSTTRTYISLASELGNPQSVRAIAQANSKNKIYILIPCHRVIATDGKLTGYGGGLLRKKWLLDFEKSDKQLRFNLFN